MLEAKAEIESKHPNTKVQVYSASVTSRADIDRVLAATGSIDILMLNAGHMHPPGPAINISAKDLATDFEINVLGPMNLINTFAASPSRGERTIIHTSSAGAYMERPGLAGYNASKLAMSQLIRMIAVENQGKEGTDRSLRAFSFHPAIAYTPMAKNVMGLKEDSFQYDDSKSLQSQTCCPTRRPEYLADSVSDNLPAHFAVWLSSPEADFLHGRFLWAHWDVEEIMTAKAQIESDPNALKVVLNVGV